MPKAAQHHAIARQWQVLRLLPTKPPGITSRALAEKLKQEGFTVTKRTVERDLLELSSIFGIACNDKSIPFGWHWMKGEYADLPGLSVSDAVSLRLVEDLLRPLLPSAIIESLDTRFSQAKAKLNELSPENPNAKWADKVRYVSPSLPFMPPAIDSGVLNAVHEALLTEGKIEIEYKKLNGSRYTYALHPLGLIQRGQITYLVATAFEYSDVRLYAIHRILAVKALDERIKPPANFSLDSYLASGAMGFGLGREITLKAWVSNVLCAVLQESPINQTQLLHPSPEGFRLEAKLHDSWQLKWWILSQGENIRVLEPAELKDRMTKHILAMCAGIERLEIT